MENGTERPIAGEKGLVLRTVLPAHDGRHEHAPAVGRVLLNLTTNTLTEYGSVAIGCSELSETEVEFWVLDSITGDLARPGSYVKCR